MSLYWFYHIHDQNPLSNFCFLGLHVALQGDIYFASFLPSIYLSEKYFFPKWVLFPCLKNVTYIQLRKRFLGKGHY